jgi:hypothetical protein
VYARDHTSWPTNSSVSTINTSVGSLAVAYHFRINPAMHWSGIINAVTYLVGKQDFEPVNHGKVLARTLLSYASDRAFANHTCPPFGRTFVSVTEYFDALLGPEAKSTSLSKAWADTHWINFTHYLEIGEYFCLYSPAPETLFPQAFISQAAVLVTSHQEDVDCFIPAYFSLPRPDPSDTFVPAHVDALAVRYTNDPEERLDETHDDVRKDRNTSFMPATDPRTGRARVLNLYLSLAVKPAETIVLHSATNSPCISVRGCDVSRYPSIGLLEPLAANNLKAFIAPRSRLALLAEEMDERFGKGTYEAACFSGREFFLEDQLDLESRKPPLLEIKSKTDDVVAENIIHEVCTGGGPTAARGQNTAGDQTSDVDASKRKRNADEQTIPVSESDIKSADPVFKKPKAS